MLPDPAAFEPPFRFRDACVNMRSLVKEARGTGQSMRITLFAISALFGLAFLPVPNASLADSTGCERASGTGEDTGIRVLADQAKADLRFDCREDALVTVTAALPPGAVTQVRMFWPGARAGAALEVALEDRTSEHWISARLVEQRSSGQVVSLRWQAPDGDEAGTRRSALVRIGDRKLAVRLEVLSADHLFRDGFDVDPVIGQFSMVIPTG